MPASPLFPPLLKQSSWKVINEVEQPAYISLWEDLSQCESPAGFTWSVCGHALQPYLHAESGGKPWARPSVWLQHGEFSRVLWSALLIQSLIFWWKEHCMSARCWGSVTTWLDSLGHQGECLQLMSYVLSCQICVSCTFIAFSNAYLNSVNYNYIAFCSRAKDLHFLVSSKKTQKQYCYMPDLIRRETVSLFQMMPFLTS